jgi:DDE family transposase
VGDTESGPIQLSFNPQLRVEVRGATVTSDAGLLLPRELDERLGLNGLIERHLTDPRTGRNLGNLLRRLVLPAAIQDWSLTSLQQRLLKTGGRLVRHARYFTLQLAETFLTRTLFRQILARIGRLAWHPT